jgi:hypothetical protein
MPTAVCDFDGVLHSYVSGWQGATVIPDPPVAGKWEPVYDDDEIWIADVYRPSAQEFVQMLLDAKWDVVVLSTRGETKDGRDAMREWFRAWDFPPLTTDTPGWDAPVPEGTVSEGSFVIAGTGKPAALVYLDDRALRFDGVFPTLEAIEEAAVPWTRRG